MSQRTRLQAIAVVTLVACTPVRASVSSRAGDARQERADAGAIAIDRATSSIEPIADALPALSLPSPIHVFATNGHESEEMPTGLHVCPIHGVTWLCGKGEILVVRDGAVERERALESGLPIHAGDWIDGMVRDVVGHWPDDAWLMIAQGNLPPPPETYTVYRWRDGRWRVHQPALTLTVPLAITPWGRGGALLAQQSRWSLSSDGPPLRGLGARAGSQPHVPTLWHCNYGEMLGPVVPFADGSLIATIDSDCAVESVIARWSSPFSIAKVERLPVDTDAGARSVLVSGIEGDAPNDLTAFGYEVHGDHDEGNQAYLAHFDGHAWSKAVAPPDTQTVRSYLRDGAGVQWAVANPEKIGVLWRKMPNDSWTLVPLPVHCEPSDLSKTDDGTVWVRCWSPIRPQGNYGFDLTLLSTVAPSRVVELAGHPLRDPPWAQ